MALVIFLRGINVGGHRTVRPTVLVRHWRHLDAISVGTAGTFVVRKPVPRTLLRAELARRLPFESEVAICGGREVSQLVAGGFFGRRRARPDLVQFVSILARRPRTAPALPLRLPSRGPWLLQVLAREDRFVLGLYRRHMRVLGILSQLDRRFGVPLITRSWSTMTAIAGILEAGGRA